MKKFVVLIAAAVATTATFAQDIMSKKGEAFLPETGDYALGFDAVPLFNVLKFNNNNTIGAGYANPFQAAVLVKRFDDAKVATRVGLNLTLGSTKMIEEVPEFQGGTASAEDVVENETTTTGFNLYATLGREWRRGNTRVQGYYGGEGILALGGNRTSTSYGNDFEDLPNGEYDEQVKSGTSFGIGARAFMGVEYFVLPKLSINLEYGFGLLANFGAKGEREYTVVADGNDSQEVEEDGSKTNALGLGTDVSQGSVRVIFHF